MIIRKNPKTDLEKKRTTFLLIGFVISLLMVAAAFEYRTYELDKRIIIKAKPVEFIQEEVDRTFQKPPEEELPEIKRDVPIEIVEDDDEADEDFEIDASSDAPVEPIVFPEVEKEQEIPDDTIFTNVQVEPQFPGGYSAFLKYLANTIKYPEVARQNGITGTVYIKFILEKDGTPTNLVVLREVAGGCTEVALKAIENMPPWRPALQNMKPVRYHFMLPVKFTLR